MSEPDDELFRYLEKEFRSDRAVAIVKDLRDMFLKYMTELGPSSAEKKLEAVLDMQPNLDPGMAATLAQAYVVADAIMTAVAIHLARTESP
jgi:hypothetical protein